MKPAPQLAFLLLLWLHPIALGPSVALGVEQTGPPDLSVAEPLTPVEKNCAARLSRLHSARLSWNEDNRIIGVSLKGADANDRTVALCSHLPGLRALVLVALPQNQLTNQSLAHIASHPALRLLSISGNRVTDGALVHIQTNTKLEAIVLNGNFTDAALQFISPLVNLRLLDLTQTHVTDAGLTNLPQLANLQTLILTGTNISNEGVQSIAQLKRLTKLYLGGTQLDDGAIEQLRTLEQLDLLFIKGTHITAEGVASLLPALPSNCEVIHDSGVYHGERVPQTAMARAADTQWQPAR